MSEFRLSPVFRKLFKFLDWKSKKSVRLVNHFWKDELDDSGLNAIIDSRIIGNVEFATKYILKQLNLVHVGEPDWIHLKYPDGIRTVKCFGKVEPIWFVKELLHQCKHLTELHVTGNFLISQEIANHRRVTRESAIFLDDLRTLRIEFGFEECANYLKSQESEWMIQRLIDYWSGRKKQSIRFLQKIIDSNVSYLLKQIRAIRLRSLYVFVDPMHFFDDGRNYDFVWKGDPIELFLERHFDSLRRLHLPHFDGTDRCQWSTGELPLKLRTLEITLFEFHLTQNTSYMGKLLLSQRCLEELRFNNCTRNDVYLQEPLNIKELVFQNAFNLKYINLALSSKECNFLTGSCFQYCSSLETLIIEDSHSFNKFENLCDLPKSLKILKISPEIAIDEGELLELNRFRRLEILELLNIRINPENLEVFTFTVKNSIMEALNSRHLNALVLRFANDILLIRDKHLSGAVVKLGKSKLVTINIYEPFRTLEIFGHHKEFCTHFLDAPAVQRTGISLHAWKNSKITKHQCCLEEINVKSNVFNTSLFNFPGCGCASLAIE